MNAHTKLLYGFSQHLKRSKTVVNCTRNKLFTKLTQQLVCLHSCWLLECNHSRNLTHGEWPNQGGHRGPCTGVEHLHEHTNEYIQFMHVYSPVRLHLSDRLTIAEDKEANCIFPLVCYENFDKGHVQHHTLHQHPHEGHQEQVVHDYCCCPTTWPHPLPSFMGDHSDHKCQLCQTQTHTQVDVDKATHVPERLE